MIRFIFGFPISESTIHNTTDHLAILNNNTNSHILMTLLFSISHNSEFSIVLNEETEALSVGCREFQAFEDRA